MDAQTFLYWALAGGFLLLAITGSIAIIYLIRILKDFAEASDSVKNTASKMEESVTKVTTKINETADQIQEYIVKPFTVISFLTERIKPFVDMIQRKAAEMSGDMDEDDEDEKPKPKKKGRFGRKK
jgi:hypothetical protein